MTVSPEAAAQSALSAQSSPSAKSALSARSLLSAAAVRDRAHKMLADKGLGPAPPTTSPYRFTDDLAELSADVDLGPGWVVPEVHEHLVAEAKTPAGKDVTYDVPKKPAPYSA